MKTAGLLSIAIGVAMVGIGLAQVSSILAVPGLENKSPEFKRKLVAVAQKLGIDPDFLATVISFETAHTFDPAKRNMAGSGAVGLIQFMPSTAKALGTDSVTLEGMSDVDQLDFVHKYLSQFKSKLHSLSDVYLSILFPAAMGRPDDHAVFTAPSKAYEQNKGFDKTHKGFVTVADIAHSIRGLYTSSQKRTRLSIA